MSRFEIIPLAEETARQVRQSRRDEFGNHHLETVVADKNPGFPCRLCLEDAEKGQQMLLFSYSPSSRAHPYRTVGPIFIHADGCAPYAKRETIPEQLRKRLLAIRAYDVTDRLVGSDVVEGGDVEIIIDTFFADPRVQFLHAHYARAGCLACQIERGA